MNSKQIAELKQIRRYSERIIETSENRTPLFDRLEKDL